MVEVVPYRQPAQHLNVKGYQNYCYIHHNVSRETLSRGGEEMTREEHKKIVSDIMANATNQGELSVLLASLSEDYDKVTTEHEELLKQNESLKSDNESLRSANMKLFVSVGHKPEFTEHQNNETKDEQKEEKKLNYEDLFNKEGELL